MVIPSGFLVPTKGSGALTVLDLNNGAAYPMTANNDGEWFYHRVIWIDMDGDGLEDIVTCRAHKPFFGESSFYLFILVFIEVFLRKFHAV